MTDREQYALQDPVRGAEVHKDAEKWAPILVRERRSHQTICANGPPPAPLRPPACLRDSPACGVFMPEKSTKTANPAAKKASARPGPRANKADAEAAVLAKIAAMLEPYRAMGERLHALILRSAPALQPTVWYGMPGYAKDGKIVCFFRADKKYMTFGLTQDANLTREESAPHQLIESAWYFTALDDATEAKLSAIVRKVAN
jgi:hypothetical protein